MHMYDVTAVATSASFSAETSVMAHQKINLHYLRGKNLEQSIQKTIL